MARRKTRTFDRYYMGQDGLKHVIYKDAIWAACGQSIIGAKYFGGDKILTCLLCIGNFKHG